jgi:hypothetical protein
VFVLLRMSVMCINAGRVPREAFQAALENWIPIIELERELNEPRETIEAQRAHIARCKSKFLAAIKSCEKSFVTLDVAMAPFVRAWFAIADVPPQNTLTAGDPNYLDSLADLVPSLAGMTVAQMIWKLWKATWDPGMKAQFV